ncbi:MAG TPA: cupin domain-containing protein, partial [Candidatus Baltobacteraceae bacterium]|nr:cupin domain-containing protein [Candidatus Baltobacteraceae bacterium]
MRRYLTFIAVLCLALANPTIGFSKGTMAPAPTIVAPGSEHWVAGTGPEKGTWSAVLAGDPTKPGFYILRMKLPAGTTFPPHFHAATENVTVISGALWVGLGDKMGPMQELKPGTFVSVPAELHH